MANMALIEQVMGPESNHVAVNIVRQSRLLSDTIAQLEKSPEIVIEKMNELRQASTLFLEHFWVILIGG